jgi:lysophospholipase L1-like esterase
MRAQAWKNVLALAIGVAGAVFLAELGARAFFALSAGPRVMLYGTDWYRNAERAGQKAVLSESETKAAAAEWSREDSIERHGNALAGYTKFFPNESKTTRDVDSGERVPVTINSQGFRGREFQAAKAPGVVRVLTLGSSSTMGYYNRDTETYPHLLEAMLNEGCAAGARYEVINFAIPHATASSIAAMYLAEGVALAPDVVTFYEGRNDSALPRSAGGAWQKVHSVLVNRLLLAAFIDQVVVGERAAVTSPNLQVGPLANERSRMFLAQMDRILEASRKANVKVIVASQQATSRSPLPGAKDERLTLRGVTYAQEAGRIRERLARKEPISSYEQALLVHQRLMTDLEAWAQREKLAFVDVIGALDQDRHHLLSWVHLHPEANRVVARKLADEILRQTCRRG